MMLPVREDRSRSRDRDRSDRDGKGKGKGNVDAFLLRRVNALEGALNTVVWLVTESPQHSGQLPRRKSSSEYWQ